MPIMHSLYRESGKPEIDPGACSQCGACAKICPAEVLEMDEGNIRVNDDSLLGCIACGHCMMVCSEGAIKVTGRGISPDDLLPLPDSGKKAGADELSALMQSRRSVRRFKDRKVDAELLERIVEMASTAPMGIPPWDIGCVTIRGKEQVRQLASEVIKGYEGFLKIFRPWLLKIMRPFVGRAKYDMFAHFVRPLAESYVRGHREGRDLLFYEAPALLIFHHSPYAEAVDATIACTYAMLAVESLGLGSTIIGGAPPILQRNKALCEDLGIPQGNTPSLCLILGYPATHFRHTIRRRFTSTVTH
jgi:nitroreductase/NAD-dependent dihydropyrimidine dehydrogenase PreA subunit